MKKERATTLGELKKTDYASRSIQLELAENLKACLGSGKATFQGLIGYENTVIPDVERAILSGHNINLLWRTLWRSCCVERGSMTKW